MALIRLNNQSISSVTALPSGIDTGKVVKSSRISDANGTINFNNGSSYADSGIDHNYTALSTSNTLIHYVNCIFSKSGAGGNGGGVTIYEDDLAISEINNSSGGLAQFHMDGANNLRSGNSFIYHQSSISSTNSIKYSLYVRGDSFSFRNLSGHPLIWTILEIES
jgi:hypothetical protein